MAKDLKQIDALAQPEALTLESFESLLEVYKESNPAKFAIKEANGEFDKMRAKLGGGEKEEKIDGRTSMKRLIELATEKGLELDGEETKEKLLELLTQ